MTWVWTIVAATAAGCIGPWVWGSRPARNELSDPAQFAAMLRALLHRGIHKAGMRGSLTVCVRADESRRLIFEKHIAEDGRLGFRTAFPLAVWSEPYYLPFRDELTRRGIPHREEERGERRALCFDFGQDIGGAYAVARVLFEDVMGLRLDRDCVAYFRHVVIRNAPQLTGVDAPDDVWGD